MKRMGFLTILMVTAISCTVSEESIAKGNGGQGSGRFTQSSSSDDQQVKGQGKGRRGQGKRQGRGKRNGQGQRNGGQGHGDPADTVNNMPTYDLSQSQIDSMLFMWEEIGRAHV